ncbi:MAG: hypothetical protein QOE33_260 [Acidobacteriota bacterium]|nr:hypothetical protein [Acidobacteriota bacterium]
MSRSHEDDESNDASEATRDARLAQLERGIGELSARLRAIEDQLGVARQQQQRRELDARPFGQGATIQARDEVAPVEQRIGVNAAAPVNDDASATHDESATVEDYPFNIPPRADRAGSLDRVESDAGAAASPTRPRRDLETLVGGSLFSWLAIITLVFGVGFFLKTAFESGWIGVSARVLLGGAAGCALLATAERLRARGYRAYAHVLTGGGVLILYLSIYAARIYELVGLTSAFALMSIVTTTAVLLSVRHDALSIAILALIGGFLTPALLSNGVDNQVALFAYVAFLDAGVLALAYFKRWRVLDHLAFVATALVFFAWALAYYESWKDWRTVFFLTLFFAMFAALALLHNVLRQRLASRLDISLALSNAALYFVSVYAVLEDGHRDTLGAFALLLSIFYVLLYALARSRRSEDVRLASAYVVAAAAFLTAAVGIQFGHQWITIGWSVEALLLTWLALRGSERAARYTALAVFAFAASRWLTIDLFSISIGEGTRFVPLLNIRALSCLALLAALACATWLYRRAQSGVGEAERDVVTAAFTLTRFALVLVLLTADANDYFAQQLAHWPYTARDALRLRLENTRQLTLSLVWTIYAAALVSVGLARRSKLIRFAGLAWLAVTALKLVAIDATFYDAAWHAPLFNQTFAAFVAFVAAAGYVARSYARAQGINDDERRIAVVSLTVVGNLFAVAALSLEASGYFHKQLDERERAGLSSRDLRLARQLSLSLVWATCGGAMLAFGHVRQNRALRLLALALLAATTLKVFFFDLAELEKFYRIVSFVALGLVLLAVSFLYQQRRAREGGAD